MRRISHSALLAALLAVSAPATAACVYPEPAPIPDGSTATEQQMIAAQQAVKSYVAAMEDYLACIAAEHREATVEGEDEEVTAQRQKILTERHNAAVEEMETVAARFNEQVRAFKSQD